MKGSYPVLNLERCLLTLHFSCYVILKFDLGFRHPEMNAIDYALWKVIYFLFFLNFSEKSTLRSSFDIGMADPVVGSFSVLMIQCPGGTPAQSVANPIRCSRLEGREICRSDIPMEWSRMVVNSLHGPLCHFHPFSSLTYDLTGLVTMSSNIFYH